MLNVKMKIHDYAKCIHIIAQLTTRDEKAVSTSKL